LPKIIAILSRVPSAVSGAEEAAAASFFNKGKHLVFRDSSVACGSLRMTRELSLGVQRNSIALRFADVFFCRVGSQWQTTEAMLILEKGPQMLVPLMAA
jgi:hypothetical protein